MLPVGSGSGDSSLLGKVQKKTRFYMQFSKLLRYYAKDTRRGLPQTVPKCKDYVKDTPWTEVGLRIFTFNFSKLLRHIYSNLVTR